jgi:hypothetical protein
VALVDWPSHVGADVVRAQWGRAQWLFSPLTGWPPPWPDMVSMELSGRRVNLTAIAAALSVVSSSSPLWEAQALIVDYCSSREEDPAPQWATFARLDPSGEGWRDTDGIAGFITDVQRVIPYPPRALVSAGQVMSHTFQPATLNGLGYLVARMGDWEECRVLCEGSRDPNCLQNCMGSALA